MRLITPETVKSLRLTAQTMSEIHSYTCASICGACAGWMKSCHEGIQYIFYLFLRYRLFTLRPGWRFLVGYHLFQIPEMQLKYEPLAATISSISFSLIWYGFGFFLSMLSITMIYTLIPCDNWAFCKADVPDDGLSSYAAKKKRINVGKGTLSAIVIYRHE